jgi:gas vesicle protein
MLSFFIMRIVTRSKGYSMNKFLKLLLGTSLYLLEQSDGATKGVRDRAADHLSDLRDAAQEKYETAADRVARASRAIRGEDSHVLSNTLRFVAGLGIGVGVGLILAPASGEETRNVIAGRVHEMGDRMRDKFSSEDATGTRG